MAEDATTTLVKQPSRYKSHRRKQSGEQQAVSAPATAGEDSILRSQSRYRRRPGTAGQAQGEPASLPPQPDIPSRYLSKHGESQKSALQDQMRQKHTSNERHANPPVHTSTDDYDAPAMNGRNELNREFSYELSQPRSPPTPTSAPTGELFPPTRPVEKPVRHDGPPQSNQIRATRSLTELSHHEEDSDSGCFGGWFKRKRGDAASAGMDNDTTTRPRTSKGEKLPIRPGGGGAVPGIDAPVSAVNAGDRIVLVEFGESKRVFPVTPTTTSLDIVKSASICMSERIDVKSAVLLEYFSTVGVQRPVRRYEYVRNVMNSWDTDRQNSLLLVDPVSGTVEPELTIAGVPRQKPEEQSWYLFYSQKMGKWEKRFVTLKPDGQIICQKDADKMKDVMNVCHLSDFDIYIPTPEKLKKKIKPPKKLCYAIKSQQKTAMFETTENFVHFFATGDKPTAESFHKAVQGWRSWYLVNVLGEGKKEPAPERQERRRVSIENGKTHRAQDSVGSHYQLGSFKPLVDMEVFEKPPVEESGFTKSANQFDVNVSPERRTSTAKRRHPHVALHKHAQLKDDEPLANLQRAGSVNKRNVATERKLRDDEPLANLQRTGSLNKRGVAAERTLRDDEPLANLQRTGSLNKRNVAAERTLRDDEPLANLQRTGSLNKRSVAAERKLKDDEPLGRSGSVSKRTVGGERRKESLEFKNTGLLGQQYSQRRKDYEEREAQPEEPWTAGPNLLNGESGGVRRQTSTRRQGEVKRSGSIRDRPRHGEGVQRAESVSRQKPKPLIDLTPEYREAPQFSTKGKGRGFVPENPAGGGLIDNATSPEDPLGIPASTDWRHRQAQNSPRTAAFPPQRHVSQSTRSPVQAAFTGEGLLGAQEKQGWGGERKGRGVIDGSRAGGKPLVDLGYDETFVNGSLLKGGRMNEGIPAPVVDRSREM